MVCMVNATAVNLMAQNKNNGPSVSQHEDEMCPNRFIDNANGSATNLNDYRGTFVWTPEEQSLLFSAGFYGNLAIMWMSGYLADRFGPTKLLFIGATGISIIALLSLTAAVYSYLGFVGIRAVNGLFETTFMPSFAAIISRWFPASERSTAVFIYSSGNQIACSIGVVIASNLCNLEFLGGWPLIFYLN
uniref:MFS domain-containing protein n=1 Tax=Panagrellus redivivus TaxID=6233 RepID=A0A7E4ZRB4_PANRE